MKNGLCEYLWPFFIALILISCSRYSADELLATPEIIEIDGREYVLNAYLWRDFMPPRDDWGGDPLAGVVSLIVTDSLAFPSTIDADKVWIINDNDVWESGLTDYEPPSKDFELKKRIEDEGPKWGPQIFVDVVIQVIDENDSVYLLRVDSQWISRVY